MKFPEAFIDELKARFRLSDYIGRTVALKRAGKEHVGLSPFNREKTPSFYVNDEKGQFFDFSSGKNGDLIDWLTKHEGMTFVDAVTRLAQEAGLPLPERDERSAEAERRRRTLEGWLGEARALFQDELRASGGAGARAYLEGRGLTPEDWDRFGIGYAPPGSAWLREALARRGAPPGELVAAGLLINPDDGRPPYDRYRNRIMFPIWDAAGRIISFGGRALDPNARAKYLNGPDTELFDKGRNLYGLNLAKPILAAGPGPLVVAEGYMDVIACLRAGIASCAPMGTALTDAQLELMWRHHPEPTLCFDGDAAGQRAVNRAIDMAVPKIRAGRSLQFSIVVGGKDPDQVLREQGPDALRSQLASATPLAEAIFRREVAAGPLDTPERRAALRERLRKIVGAIGDRDLAREYGETFRSKLGALRQRPASAQPAAATSLEAARSLREAVPPVRAALAYWLVKDPSRAFDVIEDMDLGHPALKPLVDAVLDWALAGGGDDESLARHLNAQGLGPLLATLADPGGLLADPKAWMSAYLRLYDYLRLERAVQETKARLTPANMTHFLALKAQRDAAKKAL